jgi:hypothetical protein
MKDNDWNKYKKFISKNLNNSLIKEKNFNKFWFRKKNGIWSIQLIKRIDGSIALVNLLLETKAIFCGRLTKFTWTSAAFAEKDARISGIFGIMMFNLHRNLPLIGSTCGNKYSLPINQKLGSDIENLKIRRFIYVHKFDCLKIVQKKYKLLIKHQIKFIQYNKDSNIIVKKSKSFPKDTNKLWKNFAKNFECCIQKNHKYLTERYLKSPFQKYNILLFRNKKNKLLGLSIIRLQNTLHGVCSRIVDFMSIQKYEEKIWHATIIECEKNKSLFSDFIVMGTNQDKHLLKAGFQLTSKKNYLDNIPNLLSPIEHRHWSYTFHLGGHLTKKLKGWRNKKKIWFTKGDGDRDFPTPYDIKYNNVKTIKNER